MATMTELAQYLLAYRKPGGGAICRYGALQTTIPVFPPNLSISWTIFPEFNAYASIHHRVEFSPAMVPNAFWLDAAHSGMASTSGFLSTMILAHGVNTWAVVTESDPVYEILTNMTALNQFCEAIDYFLIVDSEEELIEINKIVRNWGSVLGVREQLSETNRLLRAIAGVPTPQGGV